VLVLGAACGGRPQPDDAALHSAVLSGSTGREVTFDARLLREPQRIGIHEHLLVSSPDGDRLEIDHNVDLAPWVPAHANDAVTVRGQLYVDAPGRAGVHCTHARTSTGCPQPGWIQLHGSYYE
jgi:hypothetical protein